MTNDFMDRFAAIVDNPPPGELTIRCSDAETLDRIIRQLPGANAYVLPGTWNPERSTCVVRADRDVNFLRFAIEHQGYGQIVASEETPGGPQSGETPAAS